MNERNFFKEKNPYQIGIEVVINEHCALNSFIGRRGFIYQSVNFWKPNDSVRISFKDNLDVECDNNNVFELDLETFYIKEIDIIENEHNQHIYEKLELRGYQFPTK